ncbi:carbonic anhydrase [Falsiroseomonas sp.]|uniref:carbonic anhydrase n=1 Tax=Falsiroseomonas sp. TaxID=2870721 RepID=UPI003F725970
MNACPCCRPAGLGRRSLLAAAALACLAAGPARAATPAAGPRHSPNQALAMLMAGHARYLAGAAVPVAHSAEARAARAAGQAPFAAILGCADSRAAPELLFNTGLGELFVVRNAGNVADTGAVGSLEYAVANLGVSLIMVLGHERCGAADAAVAAARAPLALPPQLSDMLQPLIPSALAALRAGGDVLDGTIRANVARSAARLAEVSPVLSAASTAGRLRIVGARYDLDDEAVTLLS